MDAVTYPNDEVATFLEEHAVCYKPQVDENKGLARRYGVAWTPGLCWLDGDGNLWHQNVGFFEPHEFLAEFLFGCARVAAGRGDWKAARASFEEVAERWPESFAAPAALYWAGVAGMKDTGETEALLASWKKLRKQHPRDSWAMKVAFIDKKR
jgi:TolA-binding protein